MITTVAEISKIRDIGGNLVLISVNLDRYKEWIPGMFLQLSLEEKGASEPWLDSRAFSFASWGSSDARILVRKEGSFTTSLIERSAAGFRSSVRYPFGSFLLTSNKNKVFMAGGGGISVFLSYLDYLNDGRDSYNKVILIHTAKKMDEGINAIYQRKIPDNVTVKQYITDIDSKFYTGRISSSEVRDILVDTGEWEFYLCGPPNFEDFWSNELKSKGKSVKMERWINKANGVI